MFNSIIPMANWTLGTILIIVFVLVCIVLTLIVLSLVFSGKRKKDEEDNL